VFPGFGRQRQGQVQITLFFGLLGAVIQGLGTQIEMGVLVPGISQYNSQKGQGHKDYEPAAAKSHKPASGPWQDAIEAF
jgi:hypothetical protein